jgi:hypothetical protein
MRVEWPTYFRTGGNTGADDDQDDEVDQEKIIIKG